jgi:hypothetical protein
MDIALILIYFLHVPGAVFGLDWGGPTKLEAQ